MMAHQGLATCLTCSKTVSSALLSKCIIHSCCSRPVCPDCLDRQPRLATFCPFCETAHHALRKGPRNDVTRAGQVLWDTERAVEEQEEEPLPSYNEARGFILEEDTNEEEASTNKRTVPPVLLESGRLSSKVGPSQSKIDRSQPATITLPGQDIASSDTLRAFSNAQSRGPSDPLSRPSSQGKRRATEEEDDDDDDDNPFRLESQPDNRTRQYWLRPNDSLHALSIRFKVPTATLCKLNALPLSTIHSTPHLIHTRPFLLIPAPAIVAALQEPSSTPQNNETIQEALNGPQTLSPNERKKRARRRAQGKFRAIVTRNSGPREGVMMTSETKCDQRAARAYVSLVESELEHTADVESIGKVGGEEKDKDKDVDVDVDEDQLFEAIVKMAVSRWEMDSDWEREMRIKGCEPDDIVRAAPKTASATTTTTTSSSRWFDRMFGGTSSRNSGAWRRATPFSSTLIGMGSEKVS